MMTTFDIETELWKKLEASSLKTDITGKIRKKERPANSTKEDIVVVALPINNEQLQLAVANVNIFVPYMTISENNVQEKVPNDVRMKYLADKVIAVMDDNWQDDFHYEVQQQQTLEDMDSGGYFVNIRLNFYSINITN
ncbi:MAG: hypothetical protein H7Y42_12280 [Chitinophagaceae bacterium]|nr:hypothetical protein [Chitinophagaceae bacterium]